MTICPVKRNTDLVFSQNDEIQFETRNQEKHPSTQLTNSSSKKPSKRKSNLGNGGSLMELKHHWNHFISCVETITGNNHQALRNHETTKNWTNYVLLPKVCYPSEKMRALNFIYFTKFSQRCKSSETLSQRTTAFFGKKSRCRINTTARFTWIYSTYKTTTEDIKVETDIDTFLRRSNLDFPGS